MIKRHLSILTFLAFTILPPRALACEARASAQPIGDAECTLCALESACESESS